MAMPFFLNDRTVGELARDLAPMGLPGAVATRLFAHVHAPDAGPEIPFGDVRGMTRAAAETLARSGARAGRLEIVSRRRSRADGFVKYLFRLPGGKMVEAVRIPLPAGPDDAAAKPEKFVVCVSCQVGCALGCVFCASGRLGAPTNLAAWEIVDQVARIRDEAPAPVRGVVFMGMGEPLLNYDAVIRAAEILSHPAGLAIARKAITISTAGIVPAIRRYTAERHRFRLAISLTSALEEKRRRLMPIEKKYPLDEVLAAAREHAAATRDRIMLEYVAISGVNVGEEDARALIERLAGIRVRLNLIEVNDASGRFLPPTREELARFRSWLRGLRQPVVRRYSGGKEIEAACGMLAGGAEGR